MGRNTLRKPCAQRNKSCKIVLAPFRKRLPMTIVANMRLGTCRARFRRGLGASLACLGRVLATLVRFWGAPGPLLGASGALLGVLGRIRVRMGAPRLDFRGAWAASGIGFGWFWLQFGAQFSNTMRPLLRGALDCFHMCILFCPCCLTMHECLHEARLGIYLGFCSPLQRGGTCAAHGIGQSGLQT